MRAALALAVLALSACTELKLAGQCEYERTITTRYNCPAEGAVEHRRLAPWNPDL